MRATEAENFDPLRDLGFGQNLLDLFTLFVERRGKDAWKPAAKIRNKYVAIVTRLFIGRDDSKGTKAA